MAEGETEDWIGFPRLLLCRFPSLLLLLSPYFFGTHLSNLVIAASAAAERKNDEFLICQKFEKLKEREVCTD